MAAGETCGWSKEGLSGPDRAEPFFVRRSVGWAPTAIHVFATSWQEQCQDAPRTAGVRQNSLGAPCCRINAAFRLGLERRIQAAAVSSPLSQTQYHAARLQIILV